MSTFNYIKFQLFVKLSNRRNMIFYRIKVQIKLSAFNS